MNLDSPVGPMAGSVFVIAWQASGGKFTGKEVKV